MKKKPRMEFKIIILILLNYLNLNTFDNMIWIFVVFENSLLPVPGEIKMLFSGTKCFNHKSIQEAGKNKFETSPFPSCLPAMKRNGKRQ
jgi:hypothetical protein